MFQPAKPGFHPDIDHATVKNVIMSDTRQKTVKAINVFNGTEWKDAGIIPWNDAL